MGSVRDGCKGGIGYRSREGENLGVNVRLPTVINGDFVA